MPRLRILPAVLAGFLGFVGAATAADIFEDCPYCPTLVKVPPGTFVMGSPEDEATREGKAVADERPQHAVTITREFALGQYPVTRGEFAYFVRDTGQDPSGCSIYTDGKWVLNPIRGWRNPGFEQSDSHPVVCISYDDAQRYVQWLSRKTGKPYRLPTEAEWEYAARAGTTTARFWGDGRASACEFANVADLTGAEVLKKWDKQNQYEVFQCRDGYAFTSPIGSFRPNSFGLYDMLGNVFQWVEDCYHDSYSQAPSDGSAWTSGECKFRVQRGGSWSNGPRSLRSANRNGGGAADRNIDIGFRVARSLAP